jgi:Domain of unknown function (DUF4184)
VPFTLAHPAAILPLRGLRYLRTAPLICGALVPDAPYFLPGRLDRLLPETHRFHDSYTVCLMMGYILLVILFVLRQPLTALLTARARWLFLSALQPFTRVPEWLFAAIAIVLGVWTHLLWDSFTHPDGWMVHRVAALSAPVEVLGYQGTVCHLLQYLSSVLGLAVLALWYQRLPTPAALRALARPARSSKGPVLLLIATAAILIGAVQATEQYYHGVGFYHTVEVLLTRTITWFALLYLVAGTIVTLEQSHERQALL